MTVVTSEHLADAAYCWKRPLYGTVVLTAEKWARFGRPAIQSVGGEYVAVAQPDGSVMVISDAAFFKTWEPRTVYKLGGGEAPMLVRALARMHGMDSFEASPGFKAAAVRVARLLDDCPAVR